MGFLIYLLFLLFTFTLSVAVLYKKNIFFKIKSYGKNDLILSSSILFILTILSLRNIIDTFIFSLQGGYYNTGILGLVCRFFGDATIGMLVLYLLLWPISFFIISLGINEIISNLVKFRVRLFGTMVVSLCSLEMFSKSTISLGLLIIFYIFSVVMFSLSNPKALLSRKKILLSELFLIISIIIVYIMDGCVTWANIVPFIIVILEMFGFTLIEPKIERLRIIFELIAIFVLLGSVWYLNKGVAFYLS